MIKKRLQRLKLSQSILEYICVAFVFATVGIAAFLAANRGAFLDRQNSVVNQIMEGGTGDVNFQESPQASFEEVTESDWTPEDEAKYIDN